MSDDDDVDETNSSLRVENESSYSPNLESTSTASELSQVAPVEKDSTTPWWHKWLDAADYGDQPETLPHRYGAVLLIIAALNFNHDTVSQLQAAVNDLGLSAIIVYLVQLIMVAGPTVYLHMNFMRICHRGMISSINKCVPIATGLALLILFESCCQMINIGGFFVHHLSQTQALISNGDIDDPYDYAQKQLDQPIRVKGEEVGYVIGLFLLCFCLSSIRWTRLIYFLYWLAATSCILLIVRLVLALRIDGEVNDFAIANSFFHPEFSIHSWFLMNSMAIRTTMIGVGLIPIVYSRSPPGENMLAHTILIMVVLFWGMMMRVFAGHCMTTHLVKTWVPPVRDLPNLGNGMADMMRHVYYVQPVEYVALSQQFGGKVIWALFGGLWSTCECLLTALFLIECLRRNLLEFIGIWCRTKESVALRIGINVAVCSLLLVHLIPYRLAISVFFHYMSAGTITATLVILQGIAFVGFFGTQRIQDSLRRIGQVVPPRWVMVVMWVFMVPLNYSAAVGTNFFLAYPNRNSVNMKHPASWRYDKAGWSLQIDNVTTIFRYCCMVVPVIWAIIAVVYQLIIGDPLKQLITPRGDFKALQADYLLKVFAKPEKEDIKSRGPSVVVERQTAKGNAPKEE